jgi:hypothetical protein
MPLTKVRSYSDFTERLTRLAAQVKGLETHLLGKIRTGKTDYPFWMLTTPGPAKKRVCLSGGIHGDEPAGVEAMLGVLSMLKKKPELMEQFHFTLFPCNNPFGYEYHTRENSSKKDLNRQYSKSRPPAEVRLIRKALNGKAFDLSIEFHEDIDTPGFYLYEIADDPDAAVADKIVKKVARKYPVNLQEEIEGAPAKGGIISPGVASDFFKRRIERGRQWPQAIYLYKQGTRHCITSETPIHLDMRERVEVHLIVLKTALEGLKSNS